MQKENPRYQHSLESLTLGCTLDICSMGLLDRAGPYPAMLEPERRLEASPASPSPNPIIFHNEVTRHLGPGSSQFRVGQRDLNSQFCQFMVGATGLILVPKALSRLFKGYFQAY